MIAIVVISFLAMAVNLPFAIAVNIGLKFKEKDPNCPDEVADVRRNITAVRVIQTFNAVASIIILILASL